MTYQASPAKRKRRTKAEIESLKSSMFSIIAEQEPMTVRQVFYQLVTRHLIDKTEKQYDAVCRLLGVMRKAGELPYEWIADNTRWMRKPRTHSGLDALLNESVSFYRRDLWHNQDAYVEVWLEKEALAGVVFEITGQWDVPLMVCRGYPSLSFLYSAAENINATDKPTHLYYFGDRDPSGVDIPVRVLNTLETMGVDCEFEVVAVTEQQIDDFSLETRPTKKSDGRSKNFRGESVELDAIPPADLRALVDTVIRQHIDPDQYEQTKAIEESERDTLRTIAANYSTEGEL